MSMQEHDRLARVRTNMSLIRDFIEHIESEHDIRLCWLRDHPVEGIQYGPTELSTTQLLYSFFGIDKEKLDAETAAIEERNRIAAERAAVNKAKTQLGEVQ